MVDVIPNIDVSGSDFGAVYLDIFVELTKDGAVFPCFASIAGIKMLTANKAINTSITCLMVSPIVLTCP